MSAFYCSVDIEYTFYFSTSAQILRDESAINCLKREKFKFNILYSTFHIGCLSSLGGGDFRRLLQSHIN
jgi:hypothetical protein